MPGILFVLCLIFAGIGSMVIYGAETIMQEIAGGIAYMISAIFLSSSTLTSYLDMILKTLQKNIAIEDARNQRIETQPVPISHPQGQDREWAANKLLDHARELIGERRLKDAAQVLEELVAKYPGTEAAKKAAKSLRNQRRAATG